MPTHAFDFLDEYNSQADAQLPRFVSVFGDEPFLEQLVINRIRDLIVGSDADAAPFAEFDGKQSVWRDVIDELSTLSLFGGSTRLVIVKPADEFITNYRSQLEAIAEKPPGSGTLVLSAKTWPGNTRLAKQVAKTGLAVDCRPPQRLVGKRQQIDEARLSKWVAEWAQQRYQLRLTASMAAMVMDLIGPHLGLIDQELAKLALYADSQGKVTTDVVASNVGGWRTKTTWELLDAATAGKGAEALAQLDRLIHAGENPLAMLGAFSWSLRRFAAATRIIQRAEREGTRPNLQAALIEAGFRKFPREALQTAESSLRQLGRERAGQLYDWLLETDLRLKGSHSAPERARLVIELLLIRLSHQLRPQNTQRKMASYSSRFATGCVCSQIDKSRSLIKPRTEHG